jgi:hypothetical protein
MWPRCRPRRAEDSVVLASVRLLRGDGVGLFNELGQGVPAWARVNVLAHSRLSGLAAIKPPRRFARGRGWDVVMADLAVELLSTARGCPEEVDFLQRAALVPLELAFLGGELPEPLTPSHFGMLVRSALCKADVQAQIRPNQSEG